LTHLIGTLRGPADTPYAGGVFNVDISLPKLYPFAPPIMKFTTMLWHPNVSSVTGAICLDILKSAWSPALTIKTALLSISALLSAPEPSDPQDAEVASQYMRDRKGWEATARFWTESYAMPKKAAAAGGGGSGGGTGDEALRQLTDMGFPAAAAAAALRAHGGNAELAMNALLSGS